MPDVPDEAPRVLPAQILESDAPDETPGSDSRLSGRGRVRHAALTIGALALALFIVLGGPAATLDEVTASWQQLSDKLFPPRPIPSGPLLNASDWTAAPLPAAARPFRELDLRPSPADPELGYLCWIGQRDSGGRAGPLNLYISANGARSWSALPVPVSRAGGCRTVPDAVDPDRVVLLLSPDATATCDVPTLYASADRGAHWTAVPPPRTARGVCDLRLFGVNGRLYVWSPGAQRQSPTAPAARLLASDDGGAMWTQAFAGLSAGYTAAPLAAHADGALLALVSPPATGVGASAAAPRALWCFSAGRATWEPLGALPLDATAAFVSSDPAPSSDCDWGSVYAASYQDGTDPAAPDAQVARMQVNVGSQWRDVPTLPANGATRYLPLGEDGRILGVGPGGLLLVHVLYTGAPSGLANGLASPSHVMWGWDPATGHWLRNWHVEPSNATIEDFAWDHAHGPGAPQLVLWLYVLNAGSPAITAIFRATVSAP